jgi:uncharacterized protein DUF4062/NACHT domain-containing protein
VKKSLNIFLSSTVKDLAPEREIATRAIETLKLEAIRMETFGSSSQTPLEICKQMVQDSDVFVGIYGGRYGYVPPSQTQSVTEIEFQEARRSGKDILVYIKASDEIEDIQAEFLGRVDDFEGGYFRRPPFRTLSELEEWLKEDLIALLSSRFVTTKMPKANTLVDEYRSYVSALYRKVTFAGLAQTPSGLSLPIESVFVAPNLRELKPSGEAGADIVDLDHALIRNHRAVIVGAPGSGKTMLLKQLACSTADKGVLLPVLVPLVSLVGEDSNRSFFDRLSDFIGSRTEQRFEGLVEDALSSSRALVMLDGLDEIDQPDKVASVLADLSAFSESYPNTRIILTTRQGFLIARYSLGQRNKFFALPVSGQPH